MTKYTSPVFRLGALAVVPMVGLAALPSATSAAIISDGNVMMGVDTFGQLNVPGGTPSPVSGTSDVGLRHVPTGLEATSHGCACEGWGVGVNGSESGSASNADGVFGLTSVSFTNTATTARSVVSTPSLRVTHDFALSTQTDDLYEVKVTIANTSGAKVTDVRYTRAFDWDVEPDTFNEVVTIQGTATTSALLYSNNDGFESPDPFASRSPIGGAPETADFVDFGPDDHGALFDFGFGDLDAGESYAFSIFYGAARTEAQALVALGEVGAELFSLGQPAGDPTGTGAKADGTPTATFIFGFKGVGGAIIIPDPTPNPPTGPGPSPIPLPTPILLLLGALGAMGVSFRRRAA